MGNRGLDYGTLVRMEYAQDVYDTVKMAHNPPRDGGLVKLQEQHPDVWDFYCWLVEEGYTY